MGINQKTPRTLSFYPETISLCSENSNPTDIVKHAQPDYPKTDTIKQLRLNELYDYNKRLGMATS